MRTAFAKRRRDMLTIYAHINRLTIGKDIHVVFKVETIGPNKKVITKMQNTKPGRSLSVLLIVNWMGSSLSDRERWRRNPLIMKNVYTP